MKVGDLVKLSGHASIGWTTERRPAKEYDRAGIITEWSAHQDGPMASGWVQWGGNVDWDIEYLEDLEVINAGR